MGVMQYLGFQFLPEDRPAILSALEEHPAIERVEEREGHAVFRVITGGADCLVELEEDHGLIRAIPGEGDAPAELAADVLSGVGAVFTTCC